MGVSWHGQGQEEIKGDKATERKHKFAIDDYEVEISEDEDGNENLDPSYWIMSLSELREATTESAVCKSCHAPLTITEVPGH